MPHRSRLDADPVVTGVAHLLAWIVSVAVTLILFPPRTHEESFEDAARRFGYPGPTRYVREIEVRLTQEGVGSRAANRLLGTIVKVPDPPRGDQGKPTKPGGRRGGGQGGLSDIAGDARESSFGTVRGGRLNLPMVQSEDLIIVTLVRPDYPPLAIDQGLEGRVELLALINEEGAVEEVELVRSAGHLLDGAAENAVKRCRFLPYRVRGKVERVYADFKFNFTLVER